MLLTAERLLVYQGISEMNGCCYVRVFERPGRLPVVIVGRLDDSLGTVLQMAIEMAAAAIQRELFPDGREFQLIQYEPSDRFLRVEFKHRSIREDDGDPSHFTEQTIIIGADPSDTEILHGPAKEGDFRDPRWTPVADIETIVGCGVERWDTGEYTMARIGGEQGEQLHMTLAEGQRRQGDRLATELGG